jgi:hypothetical protein
MFVSIFLDASFGKADVAARRLPGQAAEGASHELPQVRPAIRIISRRRVHDHDR